MTNAPTELIKLVLDKIAELGDAKAREYFDVSAGTISAWKNLKTFPSIVAAQKVWDESPICQTPELWGSGSAAHIQILLPTYRYVHPLTHVTLFANYKKYGPDKINIIPKFRTLIDEARNDLIAKARLSKSEWFVMSDEDAVLPIGSAATLQKHGWAVPNQLGNIWALDRLMSHPADKLIVGVLYRDRRGGTRAANAKGYMNPQENARLIGIMEGRNNPGGLEETGWVGTHVIRFHRSVFDIMEEHARKPGSPIAGILPPAGRESDPIGFFGRTSQWRGEDIAVCRRAELCGIKSYVDTGLYVGHEGDRIF